MINNTEYFTYIALKNVKDQIIIIIILIILGFQCKTKGITEIKNNGLIQLPKQCSLEIKKPNLYQ